MLQPRDEIIGIGADEVVGFVIRYTVGPLLIGVQSPGDLVEVQVGGDVLNVSAVACRVRPPRPSVVVIDDVPTLVSHDGATMPSGGIDDVTHEDEQN